MPPRAPPPRERAPWTHLSNALRRHHPTHEASNGPAEYRASLEHDLPDVTGPGLHGYATAPPPPGTPTQEWEDEYAVDVTDMTAYVESVEDPEQDTVLSLLAYHSWRWGHQVTLHRPQDGPHQWSPEQTAKWDIVLQLTPEGFYILTHSGVPDATPNAQALPLAQPQEDDADTPLPEECNWDPPTATTERMPHRLTKRHLPHDYHATNDSRGRRTLPLQWASPEGTFTWGEILPGTVALTYLWLRDAETHAQPPGTHLLLTLEGEAAVENVHTAEGEDYVTANADTAVWLHAHQHTTPPTVVPGSHPWHVVIVRLPTGADAGSAQQGWADRWAHVCASLHEGLHRPSLTSHTLEPAPTTAESHTGAAPPSGVWAYTRTLHRGAAEALKTAISNHQGLVHTPHDNTQKGYTLWWHHPAPARRGPAATGRPAWHRPRPHGDRPRRCRHGPASWGAIPVGTVHHQGNGGTPQPSFHTLPGTPHSSHPTGPRPPRPRCVGSPHPRAPRHRAQNGGRDGTHHQTTPQYRTPLRHTNAKRHRHPQQGSRPLLPPGHA